jgi:hypothetical protein
MQIPVFEQIPVSFWPTLTHVWIIGGGGVTPTHTHPVATSLYVQILTDILCANSQYTLLVTPIYMSNEENKFENYRPISVRYHALVSQKY